MTEKYVSSGSYLIGWGERLKTDGPSHGPLSPRQSMIFRMLVDMLHAMPNLRMICGFVRRIDIPSESTFPRAFAEFARDSREAIYQ